MLTPDGGVHGGCSLIFGGQYSGATDFNDVWLYNTTGATFVNLCDASSCGTAPAGRVVR